MYTLWYAVKLMKLQPALFIRSAKTLSQEPPKMDIYDALHASSILLSYAREMKRDNFSTKGKSFLTAKPPCRWRVRRTGLGFGYKWKCLGGSCKTSYEPPHRILLRLEKVTWRV